MILIQISSKNPDFWGFFSELHTSQGFCVVRHCMLKNWIILWDFFLDIQKRHREMWLVQDELWSTDCRVISCFSPCKCCSYVSACDRACKKGCSGPENKHCFEECRFGYKFVDNEGCEGMCCLQPSVGWCYYGYHFV